MKDHQLTLMWKTKGVNNNINNNNDKFWPYHQMVYAQPITVLENDTHKLLWDFDTQTDHLISAIYQTLL